MAFDGPTEPTLREVLEEPFRHGDNGEVFIRHVEEAEVVWVLGGFLTQALIRCDWQYVLLAITEKAVSACLVDGPDDLRKPSLVAEFDLDDIFLGDAEAFDVWEREKVIQERLLQQLMRSVNEVS